MARTQEQDVRVRLLNTLLTTPHRKLEEIWPVHTDMVKTDPRFYVRLASWYADGGDVRDHKEMFVITLLLSDFDGHRDVGLAMLREMPPYQVQRAIDFISGRKTTRKVPVKTAKASKKGAKKAAKRGAKTAAATAEPVMLREETETFGLFKNVPRSVKTEVERYLREREADAEWFDSSVLIARKAMKRLYALLHVKPGKRAQEILFDEQPPADSKLFALKKLAKAENPAEQARMIVEHEIPYRVAATVVSQMTPTVLAALIDRMSPQELINNMGSLQRRGAMQNAELKSLIEQKLERAKTGPRVAAFKASKAVEAANVSQEMKAKLDAVADARVKAKCRIERPVALFIDKSSSMTEAIELGKRIGAMLSTVCARELYVYAFDSVAYPVDRGGDDLASWETALKGITAAGATSCGAPLEYMRFKKQYVEQIIIVTDQEENTAPLFADTLVKYREQLKTDPGVCIVALGKDKTLETRCRDKGIGVEVFAFTGDYYALPNLIPLLSKPSKLELVMEIMEYPLPARKRA